MDLWPAIDILDGRCVRLRQGDFADETAYGDPLEVAVSYLEAGAERLHVVDLDAARSGEPVNREVVIAIARRTGLLVQTGGGVRDEESAAALLDRGIHRVVVGTLAVTGDRDRLARVVGRWPNRVVVGLDYRTRRGEDGHRVRDVAVRGWTEESGVELEDALIWLSEHPVAGIVVTDIRRDGTGAGPDLAEYQALLGLTACPLVASGGIGSASDIVRLSRLEASGRRLAGVIVGKALLSGVLTVADARQAALGLSVDEDRPVIAVRIIPCLDVDRGRVVKGVTYVDLRDAGDPVELAAAYSEAGADELVILDITASSEGRETTVEVVHRAAERVFIPLTVGGGIRSTDDARRLLRAGADKISVNSAAIERPELVRELASEFGSQCVVLAIDVKRRAADGGRGEGVGMEVVSHGGRRPTGMDVLAWVDQAEALGAGELLVTSMDRDGTESGYDVELLAMISNMSDLPLVASGGVGNLDHLAEGYLEGGADGLLAASIFHFGRHTIGDARRHLALRGVPVRPDLA